MSELVKVGLIGFGTIGAGVAKILLNKTDRLAASIGRRIELARICDKDISSDRGVDIPAGVLTNDLNDILNDPEITIGIELIGGLEPARTFVLALLDAGKDVVTANKALLANHGPELFEHARKLGRTIAFEAAVGGGIPVISSIATSLQANEIESILAILNGTSNFILSRMEQTGANYHDALREAQQKGYAEANPAMDVDGTDAVQKLSILSQLAFAAHVNWKSVSRVGIDCVDAIDIRFARELAYSIRLIASAKRTQDGLELKVSPTLVPCSSPLAKVDDAFNAIQVVGDFVGPVFYQGWGAGQKPTASAVVSDVIDTALGRTAITSASLRMWSGDRPALAVRDAGEMVSKAYLRLIVDDKKGVMSVISGILGEFDISISSMLQPEKEAVDEPTYMIIMTHATSQRRLQEAVARIRGLDFVYGEPVCLAVQG
ncbi:MAG: homoserine dehydrogenase [Planctomycetia bacterium]|nr:homoserine dehydrogenase [Planctomycetia bacterium]